MFHSTFGLTFGKTFHDTSKRSTVIFRETQEYDGDGDGQFDSRITLEETYAGRTINAVDQWIADRNPLSYPYVPGVENIENREGKLLKTSTREDSISQSNDEQFFNPVFQSDAKVTYNRSGDISNITSTNWDSGGMQADSITSYKYGKKGLLAEKVTVSDLWISSEEKGDIDFRTTEEFVFDRKGRLTQTTTEYERKEGDNLITNYPITTEILEYGHKQKIIHEEIRYSYEDGLPLTFYTKDLYYDADGNLKNTVEYDFGRTIRRYFEYDEDGRLLKDDKVVYGDYRYTYEFEYDYKGRTIKEALSLNKSGGDEIENQIIKYTAYTKRGEVSDERTEYWINNPQDDGTWALEKEREDSISYDYERDRRGRVIETIKEYDQNNDGTIERVDTDVFKYGKTGYMISKTSQHDLGNDGIVDYKVVSELIDNRSVMSDCDFMPDQLLA